MDMIGGPAGVAQLVVSVLQLEFFGYLVKGGWITLLRTICFFLDKLLVGFISRTFDYFELIVSKDLFVPGFVENLTKNVYFFVAIILLFKLAIRFLKYIMDPDLVSDKSAGTNAIIKRSIIGISLIVFLPMIFSTIREFQRAIIEDDVVNKIIMDSPTQIKYNDLKSKAPVGRILGFTVLEGFLDFDDDKFLSSLYKRQWNTAKDTFDPAPIDINAGGNSTTAYLDTFYYDYFPIISTIALGYTLFLLIKYCFDVLIRFFKLAILQIISPIIIVDYIIDGGGQGSFKNWLTTVISTFAMLFIRILALSLIIMVCMQMNFSQKECVEKYADTQTENVEKENNIFACENSILYVNDDGETDKLLRAGIIIALLAFSMDLPKLIGSIFGLDLEQESSVTGMIKKIGGVGKMVGISGLAFGGGLLGGAVGGIKSAASIGANWNSKNKALNAQKEELNRQYNNGNGSMSKQEYDAKMAKLNQASRRNSAQAASQLSATTRGMAFGGLMAAAGRTGVGSAAISGYQSSQQSAANGAREQGILGQYYANKDAEDEKADQREKELEKERILDKRHAELREQAEKQTGYARKSAAVLGVKDSNDAELTAINDAMKNAGQSTISEQLGSLNTTSEVTRDHVVNIKDNVKTVANTTNDISRNVETAVNTTQTIAQNTDTIVNQTANISHKVDQIEDNTFYSGVDAIEKLDLRDSSSGSNDTIGGVSVSKPDSLTGERTTASGLVVPGSVDIDNK